MTSTPEQRHLQTRIAAHIKWAQTDPVQGTEKARQAALDRFEKQVDPDLQLEPAERARRAEHAKKAYFLGLALKSATARKKPHGSRAPDHPTTSGTQESMPS